MQRKSRAAKKKQAKEVAAPGKDKKADIALELNVSKYATADPSEGIRLIRAFLRIRDPLVRVQVIEFVEKTAGVEDGSS